MTSQSEINQTQSLPFLCVLVIHIQSLMTYELVVYFSKKIRSHLSFTVLNQFIFSLLDTGPLGPVSSKAMHLPTGYRCGWLAGVFHVEQMQPWQQPRSQNIVTPAKARIVNEAGILLWALQSRQNGEGLKLLVLAFLV